MRPFTTRTWRMLVGALIPAATLMFAAPAFADRDDHRGRYHKEWRDHDRGRSWDRGRDRHHGRDWNRGHGRKHHWRHRHDDRVVIVRPRPRVIYREPPRVIYREPPRVYYVEPPRYRYYERHRPGVTGSVTFGF